MMNVIAKTLSATNEQFMLFPIRAKNYLSKKCSMLVRGEPSQGAVPVWFATKETWPGIRASPPGPAQAFAAACGFERARICSSKEGAAISLENENLRAHEQNADPAV